MSSIAAVDLFCGAGGLTNGLQKAGIRVAAGYDINPLCAFPYSYNNNTKFIHKSIEETSSEEIGDLLHRSWQCVAGVYQLIPVTLLSLLWESNCTSIRFQN